MTAHRTNMSHYFHFRPLVLILGLGLACMVIPVRRCMAQGEKRESVTLDLQKTTMAEVLKEVDTLKATIQEKEDTIATQVTTINNLNQQLQDLNDLYKKEQGTVALANRDIDGLQENIKRKMADIEALKVAGLKMKKGFKAVEAKAKSLKKSKISLEEKLRKDSATLQELQGYVVTYCEGKEEDMYITSRAIHLKR